MENITLGQIASILAFIVAIIGSIEYLCIRIHKQFKKTITEEIKPIQNRLNDLELQTDKNFIVHFLSDIKQENKIDKIEYERFFETYESYKKLGGNGYIKHEVDGLTKEGKL